MSEESKKYRAEMKAKAHRLAGGGDPHQKVDASDWAPPPAMHTTAPTGPRPVSRRQYKSGGHVAGEEAKHHAGRRPRRASGGKALVRDLENADVKTANEDRDGIKHDGGMKKGGRTKRAGGGGLGLAGLAGGIIPDLIASGGKNAGPMGGIAPYLAGKKRGGRAERDVGGEVPTTRFQMSNGPSMVSKAAGLKRGGAAHPDEKEDEKLIHREVKESALKRAMGGEASHPIGNLGQFAHPAGGRMARAKGGELNARERNALPKGEFGEPASRKYPMPDRSHAANAKARASEMEHKGRLSKGQEEKIDAKADRVLARKSGGRAKDKMNVNIVIAPGGQRPPQPMAAPPMPPPAGGQLPLPPRPPMPPPSMGAGPPGMPPGAMSPPPMRKRGGLVDGGAGGGLGRLEKVRDYGDEARKLDGHY